MLEAYAEQMQNKCRVSGSTVMVSSVDDLKSYSHDLALKGAHDEMETTHLFFFFLFPIVTYMGVTLRGCMSSFSTTGSQLIFLISRPPWPSVVMGAVE